MLVKMRSYKEYIHKPSNTDTPSAKQLLVKSDKRKKDYPNLQSQGRAATSDTVSNNNIPSKIPQVGSGTSGTVISDKSSTIPPPPPLPPRPISKNHLRRHTSFKMRLRPFFLRLCSPPRGSFYAVIAKEEEKDSEIQADSSSIIAKGQEVDQVRDMIEKLCIQQEEIKRVVPKLQDFIQVMNRHCNLLEEALAEVEQLKVKYHMLIVEKATDDHAMNNRFQKITETEGAAERGVGSSRIGYGRKKLLKETVLGGAEEKISSGF